MNHGARYSAALGSTSPRDRTLAVTLALVAAAVFGLFALLFSDLVTTGLATLSLEFLTSSPSRAGREGGIFPVIASTGAVVTIAIAVGLPVSIGSGLLLTESGHRFPRLRVVANAVLFVLAAVPSVVYGLFGNALFVDILGFGYSVLSGGLTLGCMILPFLVHISVNALEAVSPELKNSAVALNLSRYRIARSILLPLALPAVLTGTVFALGRALSETAAVLFTSGYALRTPNSVLDPGRVISVHIYDLAMNVVGGQQMAYSSAIVLMLAMMLLGTAMAVSAKFLKVRK